MNILLTGGHSGIGLELTKRLLKEGHYIGLIVRSEKRKSDAIEAIGSSENIDFFFADLSKRADIKAVADSVKGKWSKVDGLFNNAGVLLEKAVYSDQGNEMQFEVNALSPYFLTLELKPLLEASENGFVVNTGTGGLHRQKQPDIQEFKRPKKFVKLLGSYLNSKFALILMMNYLAREWPGIRFATVDPGPNKTKMTKGDGMPGWLKPFRSILFAKPGKGGKKLYDAAFGQAFLKQSGIYVSGGKVRKVQYELQESELKEMIAD